MTAKQQVDLWASTDIAIHLHGAALGSWQFLPHNAVAVHIVPHPGGVLHDNTFSNQLASATLAKSGRELRRQMRQRVCACWLLLLVVVVVCVCG
jgi:hypothetical protein